MSMRIKSLSRSAAALKVIAAKKHINPADVTSVNQRTKEKENMTLITMGLYEDCLKFT